MNRSTEYCQFLQASHSFIRTSLRIKIRYSMNKYLMKVEWITVDLEDAWQSSRKVIHVSELQVIIKYIEWTTSMGNNRMTIIDRILSERTFYMKAWLNLRVYRCKTASWQSDPKLDQHWNQIRNSVKTDKQHHVCSLVSLEQNTYLEHIVLKCMKAAVTMAVRSLPP